MSQTSKDLMEFELRVDPYIEIHGIGGKTILEEPRLSLYGYLPEDDYAKNPILLDSIPLSDIFDAYYHWKLQEDMKALDESYMR